MPEGLKPQSSLLGGANRLRHVPPGFSMVGGLGPFSIAGQAGLKSNDLWAYGVVGLKTTVLAMILSSKP